jgi:hypothetical protein
MLARAPDHLKEKLLAALNVQCPYHKEKNQVTIWATRPPSAHSWPTQGQTATSPPIPPKREG